MRTYFIIILTIMLAIEVVFFLYLPIALYSLIVLAPLAILGLIDMLQTKHSIRRNYPIIGNMRFLFESIRPEINQYFVESEIDGMPINREYRSLIYTRSKNTQDTIPFGTKRDTYAIGYEWINHSMLSKHIKSNDMRIIIGGKKSPNPYSTSLLNISAMSYGSLSNRAILSLNRGAKKGNFAHNTGEGGISPHHTIHGGDLIWQIGTGYFGCRNHDGTFSLKKFTEKAQQEQIKLIEIKISQGAKPGHGGILPKSKLTSEIATIRDVPLDEDVNSPPYHKAFDNPIGLMEFVQTLQEHSKKPVGFKFCLGRPSEFVSICKAMLETGITPDFISLDGGEGGTGAAPVEFSNSLGTPLYDALPLITNILNGLNLKKDIKIFASGKLTSAFGMIKRISLGADLLYSARGFMFSLGCIQALKCNSNECPTGVATQNPKLIKGLVVNNKYERVYNYHKNMIKATCELLGAMGLTHTNQLSPNMVKRRVGLNQIKNYAEIYEFIETGSLLERPGKSLPPNYKNLIINSSAKSFNSYL